jgi:predicted thioesterase
MKASLGPGVSRTSLLTVDRDRSIGFMGEEGRVYGTPFLVRDIEQTCRELLLEHGDAGEDSVGTDISIKHLAPTLVGMSVEIKVTVNAVEGAQGLVRHIGQGRDRTDLQRHAWPVRGRRGQDD